MKQLRRKFVKNTVKAAIGATMLGNMKLFNSCSTKNIIDGLEVFIPMPVQVVIDDDGWWSGKDGSRWQEPYRTGIIQTMFRQIFRPSLNWVRRLV